MGSCDTSVCVCVRVCVSEGKLVGGQSVFAVSLYGCIRFAGSCEGERSGEGVGLWGGFRGDGSGASANCHNRLRLYALVNLPLSRQDIRERILPSCEDTPRSLAAWKT